MALELDGTNVFDVETLPSGGVIKVLVDTQYHIELAYDANGNNVTATVLDYTNAVQTTWANAITYTLSGVAGTATPTNGVATVAIDPSTAGDVTIETTVNGVRNGSLTFTPNTLATAKKSKIAELRQGYAQTIASGFSATVGTTQYTFGWQADDKATLADTQDSVNRAFLTFPFNYADINGHPVPINAQTDLDAIESTATKFFNAQHQQVLNLVGNASSSTMIDAVNAITWSPATY